MKCVLSRATGALTASALFISITLAAGADPVQGTIYFTTYNPINAAGNLDTTSAGRNVHKVDFSYNGVNFNLSPRIAIARTGGADGIIFHPDGDLLVGGQNTGNIYKVNPVAGTSTATYTGINAAFHLTLNPAGTTVYSGGIPGGFVSTTPVSPMSTGTVHGVTGEDGFVTQVSFDPTTGKAYYTNAGTAGSGGFGEINVGSPTFITDRKLTLPSAHGMAYDSFTGDMFTFGDGFISQIDLATLSQTTIFVPGMDFDQGTVDGNGHLFVASNNGMFFFMDYSATQNIAAASNFRDSKFLANFLDDVAPLSGAGAQPVPLPGVLAAFPVLAGATLFMKRSRRHVAE